MARSTLLQTVDAVIQGYNTWTPESIMSFRAPDCIHQVLPLSLGRPSLNNEQYLAYFKPIMPAFEGFHLTVSNTIVDEVAKQVAVSASSTAMTELGEYKNEYMLVLYMTEDGTRVVRMEEFVDSKFTAEFLPRLREQLAAKEEGL